MRVQLFGAPFAIGGAANGCRAAPRRLLRWRKLRQLGHYRPCCDLPDPAGLQPWPRAVPALALQMRKLGRHLSRRDPRRTPIILGGDHTTALAVWPNLKRDRPLGLLWIDAHLDSHTPLTSPSLRVHGMPLALLLGEGDPRLHIDTREPILDAAHTVVIGARSFEAGETQRLDRLGVRYYTQADVIRQGFHTCFRKALRQAASAPGGFGVSLDLDALNPVMAPAVSVREPGGLSPAKLALALRQIPRQRLRGLEIVEYNPYRDYRGRTRGIILAVLRVLKRSR